MSEGIVIPPPVSQPSPTRRCRSGPYSPAGFIIGFMLAFGFVTLTTQLSYTPTNKWQREAVDRGAAEYYLDENFVRQWRWKEIIYTKDEAP